MVTLERILAELEAELELVVRWRGGELDKVLDAGHATLEGALASALSGGGWLIELEVTYSIGGDRGSVDLLAFHPATGALLVAEIKTDVTSADTTLRRHDEKVRVAERLARERFGWDAAGVSRLLVLPAASTPRRRVRSLASVLDHVYPDRGTDVRRWLRRPAGRMAGIAFVSVTTPVGDRRDLGSRRRVARPRHRTVERGEGLDGSRSIRSFVDSTVDHQDAW